MQTVPVVTSAAPPGAFDDEQLRDLILLDSAIASIAIAIEAIEDGDGPTCMTAVGLTGAIVGQLYLALAGRPRTRARGSMALVYNFSLRNLPFVTVENGPSRARQIRTLLMPLRDVLCLPQGGEALAANG